MVRTEFVIVGAILVIVGLGLISTGYDKIQPSMMENVASFAEKVTGQPAPDELHPSKATGYLLMLFGGVSFVAGLGFILNSRKKE